MSQRPRLVRSIPFWILVLGSLASALYGTLVVVDRTGTMTTTLADGSATGVEVYAGQAWVTFGAALVGAGLVGLVAALFLAVAAGFVPAPAPEVVEPPAGDEAEPEAEVEVEAIEAEVSEQEPDFEAEDAASEPALKDVEGALGEPATQAAR